MGTYPALGALSPATVTALREYVAAGGGLILSGLGASLVDDLGFDRVAPNDQYWGPLTVPGGGEMAWASYGSSGHVLGLKPVVAAHPIFSGLWEGRWTARGSGSSGWDLDAPGGSGATGENPRCSVAHKDTDWAGEQTTRGVH